MSVRASQLVALLKTAIRDIEAERTRSWLPGMEQPPDIRKVARRYAPLILDAVQDGAAWTPLRSRKGITEEFLRNFRHYDRHHAPEAVDALIEAMRKARLEREYP